MMETQLAYDTTLPAFQMRPVTLQAASRQGSAATRGLVSDNTESVLADELRAVLHQLFVANSGKKTSLPAPSTVFMFVCYIFPREGGEEKDVGGKRSCTQTGPCLVVPVC